MADLVAVVDLGSTAVRCVLAKVRPDVGYEVLVRLRVPTRLGGGAPGTLPRKAIRETLSAVRRFLAEYSSKRRGPRVIAVATSAVRDAANREQLLTPLRRDLGIEVQILSPRDEARLGVTAALGSLAFGDAMVADLGGSSLQLSRVRNHVMTSTISLPLGAVRSTRRFLRHDPPGTRELQALRTEIRAQLAERLSPARRGEVLVGLGGTIRNLAAIHVRSHRGGRQRRHGLVMRQSDVTAVRERLEGRSARKRRKIRGLSADRADVILAGAIVLEDMLVFGGYRRLLVCTRGVYDGILLRETFDARR